MTQTKVCLRCDNSGFIIWVYINSAHGPQRYEVRPGDVLMEKVKPKDMCLERCDCSQGNDFTIIR